MNTPRTRTQAAFAADPEHLARAEEALEQILAENPDLPRPTSLTVAPIENLEVARPTLPGGNRHITSNDRPLVDVLNDKLEDLDPESRRARLWRDRGVDPDRTRLTITPDGRRIMGMRGMKDLPPFPERSSWSARDAAHMHDMMIDFFADPRGGFMIDSIRYLLEESGKGVYTLLDNYASGEEAARALSRRWGADDFLVAIADDEFIELLASMAIAAPAEPFHADELIAPHGVIFLKEIESTDRLAHIDAFDRFRAITWWVEEGMLAVQLLGDQSRFPGENGLMDEDRLRPYLSTTLHGEVELGAALDTDDQNTERVVVNLLRAFGHLSRAPIVRDETFKTIPDKARKKLKGKRHRFADVRYLSLRPMVINNKTGDHPDRGTLEDAAEKRRVRRHLTRGHWRNQWYPSLKEHRLIWIDDHWSGSADIGSVNGKRIYIARGA